MMGSVPYWGWVVFLVGLIAISGIALAMSLGTMWKEREKRDGRR